MSNLEVDLLEIVDGTALIFPLVLFALPSVAASFVLDVCSNIVMQSVFSVFIAILSIEDSLLLTLAVKILLESVLEVIDGGASFANTSCILGNEKSSKHGDVTDSLKSESYLNRENE